MNDLTVKARDIFSKDRYATELTGIDISSVEEHAVICTLTVQPEHCNARGVAMGGVLYTIADFAAAVAANSDYITEGNLHWVTLNVTVHFLSPAPLGTHLVAHCSAMKHGRATALYQTIIESPDNGKRYAIVETTMIYI